MLERILPDDKRVENFNIEREFPKIGRRTFVLNARKLYQRNRGTCYILIRFDDLNDNKFCRQSTLGHLNSILPEDNFLLELAKSGPKFKKRV